MIFPFEENMGVIKMSGGRYVLTDEEWPDYSG